MPPTFRRSSIDVDTPCQGGREILPSGSRVPYVELANNVLQHEIEGRPFGGFEHVRKFAHQRGRELDLSLRELLGLAPRPEFWSPARKAWKELEEAAEIAKAGTSTFAG